MKRRLFKNAAPAVAILAVPLLMPVSLPTVHAAADPGSDKGAVSDKKALSDRKALSDKKAAVVDDSKLARGRYLVTVAGCNDCHTPWISGADGPEPDMSRMLSGHPAQTPLPPPPRPEGPWVVSAADTNTAWSGPWGISYTANLTPDRETGLGKWTQRNFTETIRTGRHLGRGRPILPPMPIPMYKHFTDADLEAIFSYLQSIPPVSNRVPEPDPPGAAEPAVARR